MVYGTAEAGNRDEISGENGSWENIGVEGASRERPDLALLLMYTAATWQRNVQYRHPIINQFISTN